MLVSDIRVSALSSRTASFVLVAEGGRYHLPVPAAWSLSASGRPVAEGRSETCVLVLHDLDPATSYELRVAGGVEISFQTPVCAGLVDVRDFGAHVSNADNAECFRLAVAAVPQGGTLRVPAGTWVSGPIALKSDMTLLLEEGAVLQAIGDRSNWSILPPHDANGDVLGSWEGVPEACFQGFVSSVQASNLIIAGAGVIDGGGDRGDWWSWPKETREGARRPRLMHLVHCENTVLLGVTVRNSPSWTIHPYRCHDLIASGLSILNPADSPNTDGFNPESCQDVVLEGVFFSVGDDCIAIKAGKRTDGDNSHLYPTRGIDVRHCRMERGHGGVVLGSEMSGGIFDVLVEDCEFFETDRGLRIKTRRGRGGVVSGVTFQRVLMDRVRTGLTANAFYFCDPDGHHDWVQDRAAAEVNETTPKLSDIRIRDVQIENVSVAVGAFLGLPEAPVVGIRIENLRCSFAPDAVAEVPLMADHVRAVHHGELLVEHAVIELSGQTFSQASLSDIAIQEGIST